jgi:hypothetical protein
VAWQLSGSLDQRRSITALQAVRATILILKWFCNSLAKMFDDGRRGPLATITKIFNARRRPEQGSLLVHPGRVISHTFKGDTAISPTVAHHILRVGTIEVANNRGAAAAALMQKLGLL